MSNDNHGITLAAIQMHFDNCGKNPDWVKWSELNPYNQLNLIVEVTAVIRAYLPKSRMAEFEVEAARAMTEYQSRFHATDKDPE